ncbi:MAG: hypothetical protein R3B39_00600 [Candidatus Paceibacterota bacterium]
MDLEKPEKIEEFIIKILKNGPISAVSLIKQVSLLRLRATKQAVYGALRKLKKSEIIVSHGKIVSLNSLWINKMSDFFAEAKHHYSLSHVEAEGFLALEDGDKITYNFKEPGIADAFWGHAFDILGNVMEKSDPIYIYNPHEWFLVAREESETALFKKFTNEKRQILVTVSGNTEIDKSMRKYFDGTYSQYYLSPVHLFKKPNYYLNIFGDYLIEAWIDEKTNEEIERFYKTHSELNKESIKSLKNIIASQGKNKISISRNKEKANKLKKMLGRDFYMIKNHSLT